MDAGQREILRRQLLRLRTEAKIGQAELARRVAVTPSHYWKVEHAKTSPSPLLLTALANEFGVPVSHLLEDVAA